ncbi:DUF1752-domain-containing protein [Colletotrichum zoysiae]|uniref:DUF1752-domain-containing protein n=1 Tax=Colletotrichum zoysiae TaxID=1216348 RepID=A0AAD9H5L1_9PEZI|nr:DUF1752-domain-containing protein [Colletotrichum zoysiae]
MPYPLDTHVLTVDTNVINKVDTSNPQNLYSMWTVFAKCAESVEQGRRLENLSWRLWNRETFCCTEDEQASVTATSLPRQIPRASRLQDIPQLSDSVDSENGDEPVDFTSLSAPLEIRPQIQRQDSRSSNRSRGKERHITSGDFEKMVVSIIKENEPLSAPLPQISSPYIPPQKETADLAPASPAYQQSGPATTESPCKSLEEEHSQEPVSPETTSRTIVVHGFLPSQNSVSILTPASPKVVSPTTIPEPRSSPAANLIQSKKQPMFSIGDSCSSSEQGHSIENLRPIISAPKRKMFQVGGSPKDDSSLESALVSQTGILLNGRRKTASSADRLFTRKIDNNNSAIADDSETDYVDESAIDDDDDSADWEDSVEDSNKSSIDEKTFFQRVDSKVNLSSRRSLITLMIEQNDRKSNSKALGNIASQSTSALPWSRTSDTVPPTLAVSPNDSDDAPLMMKRGVRSSPLKPIAEVPWSAAQPIYTTASHRHLQAASSPRTTRRNMFTAELQESLCRHILWERRQKFSTANAVLRRRHTSHDVANLKQYPEKVCLKKEEAAPTNNPQFFSKGMDNFGGYHAMGW